MSLPGTWTHEVWLAAEAGADALRAQRELEHEQPWSLRVGDQQAVILFVAPEEEWRVDKGEPLPRKARVLNSATVSFIQAALDEMLPDIRARALDLAREAERESLDRAQEAVMPPEIRKMTETTG